MRRPGLTRHGVEGRRPVGPARSWGSKVWQGAEGGRHRGWPRWGLRVRAPGMGLAPRRAGTGRVEVRVPVTPPPARACPSSAAYNGVPSPGELRGHGTMGISLLRGVSGHPCRPPPHRRQSSAWPLEPRELSSCRQGQTRCSCHVLALARVSEPSPRGLVCWYHPVPKETEDYQVSCASLLWRES